LSGQTLSILGLTSLDKALKQLVSAQSKILLSTCVDEDRARLRQRYAYLAFVFTTGNGNEVSWFENADECKWEGLTCNGGRISQIDFYKKGLTGTIPVDVGLWYNLTLFRVTFDGLTGSLPSSIGKWTGLTYFNVANNALRGSLPSSNGEWTGLNKIYLQSNQFTGTVPKNVSSWTAIQSVFFHDNSFNGIMPQLGSTFCPKNTSIGDMTSDCLPSANLPPEIICKCCSFCCTPGILGPICVST
jgi:hypothetical protein